LYPLLQQDRRVLFQQYHSDAVYEGQPPPGFAYVVQQRNLEQFLILMSSLLQCIVHVQAVALVTTIHLPEQCLQGWP
jgi:hypothetical protein